MSQMRSFLRGAPSTPSVNSSASNRRPYHAAASRRRDPSKSPSQLPPVTPTPLGISSQASELYPNDNESSFEVDFHRVYRAGNRLEPERLSYAVTHKSQLAGKREISPIWRYGVRLLYSDPEGKQRHYWLCQRCHNEHAKDSVKAVDGYNHIVNHMKKYHRIDVKTGLLPEAALPPPSWGSPFDAAKVAGSNRLVSHTPWQEEQLQAALIDWVILKDISFAVATSPELRGLLTWNRSDLLKALPTSRATIAEYTRSTLKRRREEIMTLVTTAASKISISVDVWTSSNHLSFLGVVAHFAGKSLLIALY
jgi:hypothetical protein